MIDVCTECGRKRECHRHHDDYLSDKTRVLCIPCHRKWHSKNGYAKNRHIAPFARFSSRRIKRVLVARCKVIAADNWMITGDVLEAMIVYGLKHASEALKGVKSK